MEYYSALKNKGVPVICDNIDETGVLLAPKSLQMVIAAMKLKDAYSLEGNLWPT